MKREHKNPLLRDFVNVLMEVSFSSVNELEIAKKKLSLMLKKMRENGGSSSASEEIYKECILLIDEKIGFEKKEQKKIERRLNLAAQEDVENNMYLYHE